jgi:hypothetical protein
MRCRTDVVKSGGRKNVQVIVLPLPRRFTAEGADGWLLRGYASARGRMYRDTARVRYLVSVDPPCHCSGDYAYLRLRPAS